MNINSFEAGADKAGRSRSSTDKPHVAVTTPQGFWERCDPSRRSMAVKVDPSTCETPPKLGSCVLDSFGCFFLINCFSESEESGQTIRM